MVLGGKIALVQQGGRPGGKNRSSLKYKEIPSTTVAASGS